MLALLAQKVMHTHFCFQGFCNIYINLHIECFKLFVCVLQINLKLAIYLHLGDIYG